jgi:hypothetical protein
MLDDRFGKLSLLGSRDFDAIADDFSDLRSKTHKALVETETVRSKDSIVGPDFVSKRGFSLVFYSRSDENSIVSIENGGFELAIDGASSNSRSGTISLRFSTDFFDTSIVAERAEQLIRITRESWAYRVVSLRLPAFEKMTQQSGDTHSGQWKLFLPFGDLDVCLASDAGIRCFAGGTLVTTTPHIPQTSNPSDIAAAKRLREALDHLGLVWHSTYAIHGWPPDEEEWRYEEFITGAPHDRKYRVRCIDFDGYDSQRDVLLYAKLFRRLRQQRKEWGLRGWDGPVLNEARRQVRAANGTQIEWHVGLEEPAARVRTLLADYTDFREEQLRVIHTPVSQMAAR